METRKIILFLAAIAGISDSLYLLDRHYNASGVCSSNVKEFLGYPVDCGVVDASKYSEFFSIPLALIGLLYYLSIFFILYFDNFIDKRLTQLQIHQKLKSHLDFVIIISTFGFLYTLYLMYIQFLVLEVVCLYCLYSALSTTIIFTLSVSIKLIRK